MAVALTNIRDLLMPGLRMTPEERAVLRKEYEAQLAIAGAAERAKYDAMSGRERAEYDALTKGMMPRLRSPAA